MRRDEQQPDQGPTSDDVLRRTGPDRWWAACRVVATSMSAGPEGARAARALAEIARHPVDDELRALVASAIADLRNPQSVDAVWERALAFPDEWLQALLTDSGHEPADPPLRALWLLLTGRFDRYAELDVDGSLLRAAHRDADPGLRSRIAEQARAAGRGGWAQPPQDPDRGAALAALDRAADDVADQLADGAGAVAGESALRHLVPMACSCRTRHAATTASVPDVLWACGDAAVGDDALELGAALQLRAALFAVVHDSLELPGEPPFPSNQMLLQAIHTTLNLAERLRPVAATPAERRLEMINDLTWPYLRSAVDLFRAVIDVVALLQRGEEGVRLLAIALAGATLDLEPFVPPQAISGRIAVQEVRFWTGVLLSSTQPVQYENADKHIRQGICRIAELDRQAGAVDATALKPALDALKLSLFAAGHFSTLVTLEMGFDGLARYEQIEIDVPDSPVMQAALRSRTALRGAVSGFGHRLDLVRDAFDENAPTRPDRLVQEAFPDER